MPETRLEIRQSQKLSQNMQLAVRFLSLDPDDFREELRKAISENPALEYVPVREAYPVRAARIGHGGEDDGAEDAPDVPAAEETQMTDLRQQLRLSGQTPEVIGVAQRLLGQLTSRGYFTQDIDSFAAENGVSPATARRALRAVQALEPAGIGARTVAECLTLQLRQRADADPLCLKLVSLYLEEIGRGNLRQIAAQTGASLARIRQCVATIRSLNPVPCSLDETQTRYVRPEFSVLLARGEQLTIRFYNDFRPALRQDETFLRLAGTLTDRERDCARSLLASASQLIQAVRMRQTTMEKIAGIIVREQRGFFLGQRGLAPLRIADAAREMGVHETTVYRALQNKYLDCGRGTFPLASFFQRELPGGDSAAAVKEMIRTLCRENGGLSDRAIAETLSARGVALSRRTVSKYRSQLDIDCSFRREALQRGMNE